MYGQNHYDNKKETSKLVALWRYFKLSEYSVVVLIIAIFATGFIGYICYETWQIFSASSEAVNQVQNGAVGGSSPETEPSGTRK